MTQKSLKKNAFYSFIKAFMNLAFPVITFPYASRILAPEGIGKINFANSVVAFFVTLALLGTNSYATREAAKIRDDRFALSKFTKEILVINAFSTLIAYGLFFILIFSVPKFSDYLLLLLICSSKIFFMIFGMDWLYNATEEFKYITIRSFIFQIISLVFLFVFVHTPKDLYWYAAFGILSAVGSNICNFIHSKQYVDLFQKCTLEIKKHLKYVFVFFGMALVTNVYTVLDTVMLGFLANDTQVGYYSASTKIVKMVIGVLTAVTAILLPRLSYYLEKKDMSKFSDLMEKSVSCFSMISIPITAGLFFLSKPLLLLFSGGKFIDALLTMQIITPIVYIISTASLIGSIISSMRNEKISLAAVICGAIINCSCNFIFIPKYGAIGAAIGTLAAETVVTLIQVVYIRKLFFRKRILQNLAQIIMATICMSAIVYAITRNFNSVIWELVFGFLGGLCIYALILFLLKNTYFREYLHIGITKIRRNK